MPSKESYQSFELKDKEPQFTAWLRDGARDSWESMLDHQFVHQCTDGSIDDRVYEAYLEQEYAFVKTAATALGYAIGKAPSMQQMQRLTEALEGLVTDQREYFEETFDALGVENWENPNALPTTRHFGDLVLRSATGEGYAESLAPMFAAEWLYATWCQHAVKEGSFDPTSHVGRWIRLHNDDTFHTHVAWLRAELDRIGPQLEERRQRAVAYLFRRTIEHEIRFHTAPYESV